MLFVSLPDANAFNARVERIFVENDALTTAAIRSGFWKCWRSPAPLFPTCWSATALIIFVLAGLCDRPSDRRACCFWSMILSLNRRMEAIQKQGIQVSSLIISRSENAVVLNDMEFKPDRGRP